MQDIYLSHERLALYQTFVRQLQAEFRAFKFPSVASNPHLATFESDLERLATELETRFVLFSNVCDIATDISRGGLLEDVLDGIYEGLRDIIPYDRIGCALLNEEGDTLTAVWSKTNYQHEKPLDIGFTTALKGSSLETILETQQPRIINNLPAYLESHPDSKSTQLIVSEGICSSLTCPLIVDQRPLGFLFFSSKSLNTYQDIHQKAFIFISRQIAFLVEKSRLYQHIYELNQQLTEALDRLKEQSCRDSLTQVFHRGAIMEFLKKSIQEAQRRRQPIAVVMADIDHFKQVNDTYGHLAGDTVLKDVCQVIQAHLRSYDAVGRFGGEEFLIVLTNTDETDALVIIERIRNAIREHLFEVMSDQFHVSISLGIACLKPEGSDIESLLLRADSALYQAKENGRDCTYLV